MSNARSTNSLPLDRRGFLHGMGLVMALPWFESVAIGDAPRTKRLVCVGNHLGFYPGNFFPEAAGKDYAATSTLKPLEAHRDELTVFSNLDHGLNGGHRAVQGFLTSIKKEEAMPVLIKHLLETLWLVPLKKDHRIS